MAKRPFRKLPSRFAAVLLPFFLSIVMTAVISAVTTLKALGFTSQFVQIWPGAWALSWIIAFPTLLVVLPVVRRLVAWVVDGQT